MSDVSTGRAMSRPTIAVALAQFLAEQEQRLSPKTFAQYRDVVELLQHSLNDYAYSSLDKRDAKRFERLHARQGTRRRSSARSSDPSTFCLMWGSFSATL